MQLTALVLENFRNFTELCLALSPGVTLLHGGNAQGKSNLLEAVSMLATGKSLRAGSERELVRWGAAEQDEIPYARVQGTVRRKAGEVTVDLVVQLTPGGTEEGFQLQKRARVNGAPRRLGDALGEVNAVLFEPQDIELVHGPPSLRRRYLNVLLSQASRPYLRELQRFTRVLSQRNSLLRAIREHRSSPQELAFWDKEVVESGAAITQERTEAMRQLAPLAQRIHRELTGGAEQLDLAYEPSVPERAGASIEDSFRAELAPLAEREVVLGATLAGPHRDEVRFRLAGRDMAVYSSRGQQRTASLALKLAEARYLAERAGDPPLLLLDDVFSELDPPRQGYVLAWIAGWEQALLTIAEPGRMAARGLPGAALLEVREGAVRGAGNEQSPYTGLP